MLRTATPLSRDDNSSAEASIVDHAASLRVVIVSDALPERNGVGTYYHDLAAQLENRVDRITLISPRGRPRESHEWFSVPLPGDASQRLAFPRTGVLRRQVEALSPNVMIVPTLGPYAYFGLKLARRLQLGTCVAHHTDLQSLAGLYWNPAIAAVCRLGLDSLQNWLIRQADTVVTMNALSLADAQRRGAARARLVGTPVAAPFIREPRRPLEEQPRRIIFIGRLAAEKGVASVLAAAARLPEHRFVICGDGPLRGRVVKESQRLTNLQYRGWLTRPQVLNALDDADLLVLPSSFETFGTVALEALARHRMVLVTNACGVAQWPSLAQGLFTIQEDEDLSAALQRLSHMSDRERHAIARLGWSAVEQFNNTTLLGWLQVLAELSQQRTSGSVGVRAVA